MILEIGDLVLCTVEKIEGTTVFVKINVGLGAKEIEGSISFSEIAPGRIRNIRDYVFPKKRIVCKILRITPKGNIELSLRRVTQKETKETTERYSQENSYVKIIKSVVGEKSDEVIKKIVEKENLYDFLQEAKIDQKNLEKFFVKKDAEKIHKILAAQKKKKLVIKREVDLKTNLPDGINIIKKILGDFKGYEIVYISAGRYLIKKESEDIKNDNKKLKEILEETEKKAKKLGVELMMKP
ncbi:hypothetical protein J4407_03540 [Candidatus Pacearchaeota archaeon]|nr:hypothetical protein [Candidatus Pacearchaeota archaeon]